MALFLPFLDVGCGVCAFQKGQGGRGVCVCLTPPVSQRCCQAHPGQWDHPEFPTLAHQNQAGLGSSFVPPCLSLLAWHFGLKFWVNLIEKIAGCVGWVHLLVDYAQASLGGNVQGEPGDGLLGYFTAVQQGTAEPALASLPTLLGNGTETLLHPFSCPSPPPQWSGSYLEINRR